MWIEHGVEAVVRKWKARDYGEKNDDGSSVATMEQETDEKQEQRLFVEFVKGTTVLECGF